MVTAELIKNNFGWKAASLILATLIWLTINDVIKRGGPDLPRANSAIVRNFPKHPITIMTAAADSRGFVVAPNETSVTLSGAREILDRVSFRDFQVFVDLTGVEQVSDLVAKIQVYPPPGISVVAISPESVLVRRVQ